MGFLEALTIVFVVFKLIGIISWSWWAVFIPMYISFAIYIGWLAFVLWLGKSFK